MVQNQNKNSRTRCMRRFMRELDLTRVVLIMKDLIQYDCKIGIDREVSHGSVLRRGLETEGFSSNGRSNMRALTRMSARIFWEWGLRVNLAVKLYWKLRRWLRKHLGRTDYESWL